MSTTEMDFTTGEYLDWADAERAALVQLASDNLHSHGKCSQEVWHYSRTVLPPSWTDAQVTQFACEKDWCGVFYTWCLHRRGLTKEPWGFGRTPGISHVLERIPPGLPPAPGDLVIFRSKWHHAMVVSLKDVRLETIDGNQRPGVERRVRMAPAGIYGYYSIDPLLRAKAQANVARGGVTW